MLRSREVQSGAVSSPRIGPGTDAPWRFVVWILAGTSIVATFVATRHGPAVTSDSTSYVAIARHLVDGEGYIDYTAEAQAHWPPGYGGILAVGEAVGIDAFTGAWLLNALAFGAIVVLAGVLVRRHVRSRFASVVALLLIAWSPALLHTADTALSEVLFSVLVLAYLLLIERATWENDRNWSWIAAAAIAAASAYLVRYAGLALIGAGTVTLFVASGAALRRRLIRAGAFALVASAPVVIWTLRNLWVLGSPADSGNPSGDNPLDVAWRLVSATSELFLPAALPTAARAFTLVALVAVCWRGFRSIVTSRPGGHRSLWVSLLPIAVLLAVYPVVLGASRLLTGVDRPSPRFLAPVLAPLVVLAAAGLETLYVRLHRSDRRIAALLIAAALIYAVGIAGWFWSGSLRAGRAGRGYEAATWKDSDLISRVDRRLPKARSQVLYSNKPNAVYWVSGREPVKWFTIGEVVALGFAPSSSEFVGQLRDDAACGRNSYLAWFDIHGRRPRIPDEVAQRASLTTVERVDDGTLYRIRLRNAVSPRSTSSCS